MVKLLLHVQYVLSNNSKYIYSWKLLINAEGFHPVLNDCCHLSKVIAIKCNGLLINIFIKKYDVL